MTSKPIIRDRPFVQKSLLTDRWWLVTRWREMEGGMREAVEKYPFDDAIEGLIRDAEIRTEALATKNAEISALKEKWQGKTANDWVETAIASEAEMVRLRKVLAAAVEALTDLRYDLLGGPWFSRVTEIRSILDYDTTKATVAAEEGTNA